MSTAPGSQRPTVTRNQVLNGVLGMTMAGLLLGFGLPLVAQTGWHEIGIHLSHLGPLGALELFGLVVLGLWCYTFTLTGSLPGLSHSKALIINVCGSSVSNLLPGGGAVGMAATYYIARSWGFTRRNISTSIIVSAVWNVLARLAMPLIGLAVVSRSGSALPGPVRNAALYGGVIGLVLLLGFIVVLISPVLTLRLGRFLDAHTAARIARLRRGEQRGVRPDITALLGDQRERLAVVTTTGWFPMTFGVVAFLGIYFVLFWRTMSAVGVDLPLGDLFAAYALGRLLTAVGVTPGGLGISEAGTLAVLVAWGADKPAAAAGVLVFAIFSHLLEVPLGAIGWAAWWSMPKVHPPHDVADDRDALPDQLR
ncbi:lysylphosphatidylglycerol synthase transmembrane domain-containing protein [Allobranchiibius sp. CTAmp26]|uniref:lysylphosphatidylglycerol synthase transmembrane domain-containing protein n=1 Tax=Allobranchiibius sp. CTAmp26 TaxID=2815214 RepID=UPI001AA1A847|nr:lysylphosphatidylglycerol synthase transmembrane domain-containing protein [Allobranchiibius sp. CTAmp26]MBO1754199.1 flippase-like domain-containing protein [Allobranchiibius sp. CTAmp26]